MASGIIREKLDAFVRKYYSNQLIKGTILGSTLLLGLFLIFNISEYYGHFGSIFRAVLFYSFCIALVAVLFFWIVKPIAGLYKLGKIISYEQAAALIGSHFTSVNDKLLNLLQLEKMQILHPDQQLLAAGIAQKTQELKPLPFAQAINFSANKKYARFLLLPIVLLGIVLVFESNIITDGTKRLLNYNTQFKQPAPFEFVLLNKNLEVGRGSDAVLQAKTKGKSLPEEIFVEIQGQKIKMLPNEKGIFEYTVKNVQESVQFNLFAGGFYSDPYRIEVSPVPSFSSAQAIITFPAYLGKPSETVNNQTEISIPEGSEISWKIQAKDAKQLQLTGGSGTENFESNGAGLFKFNKRYTAAANHTMQLFFNDRAGKEKVEYHLQVVPDNAPRIAVEKKEDSADNAVQYFLGSAQDDYGIVAVRVILKVIKSEDAKKIGLTRTYPLQFEGKTNADFYYVLDTRVLGMTPGEEVEYVFEVCDNDGIRGSKCSRTLPAVVRKQTLEEIKKSAEARSKSMGETMQNALQKSQELQKTSNDLRNKINSQKNINNYENKQNLNQLLQQLKALEKKKEELQKNQQKLQQEQNEMQQKNPEKLEEIQKKMDELMQQLNNPEMQKLLEELEKLLEENLNKDKINDKLQEINELNKESAKEMEKMLEQLKQAQLEQKMEEVIDKLEKLAEKQEKLAEQNTEKSSKSDSEKQKMSQQDLEKELKKLEEEIKEAEKINESLEDKMDLETAEKERQEAEKNMQEAGESLSKGKKKQSQKSQQEAAKKMKEAAQKMKDKLQQEKDKNLEEDYQTLRALLENLIETSFEQEKIFTQLSTLKNSSPKFASLNKEQMKIKEVCKMLEDSLMALAKRQPMVSTFVTKEISRINTNMNYALEALKVREYASASVREQYIMTGLNNLAVLLMESLMNMQEQMSKKPGKPNPNCKNPGNGKGAGSGKKKGKDKGSKLSEGQKQLGEKLLQMQKNGAKMSQGKEGKKQMNKEFAQMALMQEALRKKLDELKKKAGKEGEKGESGNSKELQETENMMEQQERDLIKKQITPETIRRQKEIETRLLEHEKADRMQETEDKREANKPPQIAPALPPQLQQYQKEKQIERELLRKTPLELAPYFKKRVKEYFQIIQ